MLLPYKGTEIMSRQSTALEIKYSPTQTRRIATTCRRWIPIYKDPSSSQLVKDAAMEQIQELFVPTRDYYARRAYKRYLIPYFSYDPGIISFEDVQDAGSEGIVRTVSMFKEQDLKEKSDEDIVKIFKSLCRENLRGTIYRRIEELHGCTKYYSQILNFLCKSAEKKTMETGKKVKPLDLFDTPNDILAKELEGFNNGKKDFRLSNPVKVIYELRRTFSDDYSYLREYMETNHPSFNGNLQEFENYMKKWLSEENLKKNGVKASLLPALQILYNNYFLSTKHVTLSNPESDDLKNLLSEIGPQRIRYLSIKLKSLIDKALPDYK